MLNPSFICVRGHAGWLGRGPDATGTDKLPPHPTWHSRFISWDFCLVIGEEKRRVWFFLLWWQPEGREWCLLPPPQGLGRVWASMGRGIKFHRRWVFSEEILWILGKVRIIRGQDTKGGVIGTRGLLLLYPGNTVLLQGAGSQARAVSTALFSTRESVYWIDHPIF